MKKVIKYLSLILIFILSANLLCACTKPWIYTDSVWYSNQPSIQIYYEEDDDNWYVDVTKDGSTEKYLFVWSGTMNVYIYPLNEDTYSDENCLFYAKINTNRSRRLVLYVRGDKIWNYEYIVITLYRKPIRN